MDSSIVLWIIYINVFLLFTVGGQHINDSHLSVLITVRLQVTITKQTSYKTTKKSALFPPKSILSSLKQLKTP